MSQSIPERRERRDVQRNLKRVLEAAHELFAERGQEHVRMEEVAQRAGVGVGTIYRRFRSKEELFAAVSEAVCSDTHASLVAATHAECDPSEKIRALVLVQYRRSSEQSSLLDLPSGQSSGVCGVFDQQRLYDTLHRLLESAIVDGQRAGSIRDGNPAVLAALCLELLTPRVFQHIARVAEADAEDLAEHTASFVLHALRA